MEVYVVKVIENPWTGYCTIWGVYSTYEKAQSAAPKISRDEYKIESFEVE